MQIEIKFAFGKTQRRFERHAGHVMLGPADWKDVHRAIAHFNSCNRQAARLGGRVAPRAQSGDIPTVLILDDVEVQAAQPNLFDRAGHEHAPRVIADRRGRGGDDRTAGLRDRQLAGGHTAPERAGERADPDVGRERGAGAGLDRPPRPVVRPFGPQRQRAHREQDEQHRERISEPAKDPAHGSQSERVADAEVHAPVTRLRDAVDHQARNRIELIAEVGADHADRR